jgi:radical SAM protein with 4Fe4S-binding SPASM domain
MNVAVTLTTNGGLLHWHMDALVSGLRRMRVSMDAASAATYKETHGVEAPSFERTVANLRSCVACKKQRGLSIDIGASFLICEANVHELDFAIEFYREIGVDFLHFKPMQFWSAAGQCYMYRPLPEVGAFIARLRQGGEGGMRVELSRQKLLEGREFGVKYDTCHGSHFDLVVGADGKVYTCCHFKYEPDYCWGDLNERPLSEIRLTGNDAVRPACFRDCKMDAINQLIERARSRPEELLALCPASESAPPPLGSAWL